MGFDDASWFQNIFPLPNSFAKLKMALAGTLRDPSEEDICNFDSRLGVIKYPQLEYMWK